MCHSLVRLRATSVWDRSIDQGDSIAQRVIAAERQVLRYLHKQHYYAHNDFFNPAFYKEVCALPHCLALLRGVEA